MLYILMILTCVMALIYQVAGSLTYLDMNAGIRCNPVGEWVQMKASHSVGYIAQCLFR